MKYVSLFAGIGGFDLALNRLSHECVYVNEWDKYAAQIYEKNFSNQTRGEQSRQEREYQRNDVYAQGIRDETHNSVRVDRRSITEVPTADIPDHDLLVGGFPCQSFSVAGLRRGFSDTRGTMFFEIARILKDKRPSFILLENVKGLLSHDNGWTFETIMRTLDELGYDTQWQVLNSKNFGVPQNRERVFVVGNLRGQSRPKIFPLSRDDGKNIKQTKEVSATLKSRYPRDWNGNYVQRIPLKFLNRNQRNIEGDYAYTVDRMNTGGIMQDMKIRRLTPLECERLQGFPDNWTEGISDTQRYKCLGNAVTVNVIEEIAKRL